jgi:hypothetical protein
MLGIPLAGTASLRFHFDFYTPYWQSLLLLSLGPATQVTVAKEG